MSDALLYYAACDSVDKKFDIIETKFSQKAEDMENALKYSQSLYRRNKKRLRRIHHKYVQVKA